ncbi:hypothetical protein Efla_003605 [Eimeria flavescens]
MSQGSRGPSFSGWPLRLLPLLLLLLWCLLLVAALRRSTSNALLLQRQLKGRNFPMGWQARPLLHKDDSWGLSGELVSSFAAATGKPLASDADVQARGVAAAPTVLLPQQAAMTRSTLAAAAAAAAALGPSPPARGRPRAFAASALGAHQDDEDLAGEDLLLLPQGQGGAAAAARSGGSRRSTSGSSSNDGLFIGDNEDEEEALVEGLLAPVPTAAAAAAAAAEDEEAEMAEDGAAAGEAAAEEAAAEPAEAASAAAADADVVAGTPDWIAAPLSASKAAQKAALRALRRRRQASSSPTWRSFLNRLPSEEDEAERNKREGLPPPHAKTVQQLPVKTLNIGGETIPYRQALDASPMFIDLETFERLKEQWADDPEELRRVQREEKAAYGISEAVPDEDWIPVRRDLPKGRLVISHGLIPVNTTTAEAGYDYVESYYDPKRDYAWSYKRYNPYKQAGDGGEEEEGTEGVEPYYRLGSEEARRYFLKETDPPQRETDDGIFRQATLAEEMISGMRRSPEGEEAWDFIPDAPFGQLAPQQNFARSLNIKDLPWVRAVVAERLRRGSRPTSPADTPKTQKKLAEAEGEKQDPQAAAAGAAADGDGQTGTLSTADGGTSATAATSPLARPAYGPLIGDPGERLPPPPPLPRPEDAKPQRMTAEEVFHRQHRHVALPHSTGCREPKLFLPGWDRLPPLPIPTRPAPWPLTYRQLGTSGLYVSEVGLGTMFMGGPQGPHAGEDNFNGPHELLSYAVDGWGVNFIDTAELYPLPARPETYGIAERIVGEWLRRRGSAKRQEVVLATKVAGPHARLSWLRNEPAKEIRGTCLSKAQILAAAEGSLKRLGVSYIDLLQLHWPQRYVPTHETGEAADVLFDIPTAAAPSRACSRPTAAARAAATAADEVRVCVQIRAWGLSNETPYGLLRFCQLAKARGLPIPASCQVHYNLLFRNDVEKQFVEAVRPQNTGVSLVAYGALAGGLLTGKYLEWLEYPTAGRLLRFPSYMQRLRGSMAAKAVREYFNLARKFEQPNLTTVSLKWVFSRPFIASTLLGFSDYYQLRENLHCLHPAAGAMTDWMEREINFIHWNDSNKQQRQQHQAARDTQPRRTACCVLVTADSANCSSMQQRPYAASAGQGSRGPSGCEASQRETTDPQLNQQRIVWRSRQSLALRPLKATAAHAPQADRVDALNGISRH